MHPINLPVLAVSCHDEWCLNPIPKDCVRKPSPKLQLIPPVTNDTRRQMLANFCLIKLIKYYRRGRREIPLPNIYLVHGSRGVCDSLDLLLITFIRMTSPICLLYKDNIVSSKLQLQSSNCLYARLKMQQQV